MSITHKVNSLDQIRIVGA